MSQIYHYTPVLIVPELYHYKGFPRHLKEIKYCACSQKRGQTDSCYLFLEKSSKELFSIRFLSTLKRITYFVLISLGSDLLILVNINFSQYYMKFINLLIVIGRKMSGVFSQIFQKHLIKCGMMGSSMKLIVSASQTTL